MSRKRTPIFPALTSKRPATIRKAEIQRALKSARASGLEIKRFEIEGRKIVIYTHDDAELREHPLDVWRRKNGQS